MENLSEAYYLSMLLIGTGSFIFGIVPVIFSFRVSRAHPFFLSLILCLGAGVLLATSLVHMLTEVQVKLKLSAQLYFCAGFLTLYIFDEISHCCLGNKELVTQSIVAECKESTIINRKRNYGAAVPNESSPFLESSDKAIKVLPNEGHFRCSHFHFRRICDERSNSQSQQNFFEASSHSKDNAEDNSEDQNVPNSDSVERYLEQSPSSASKIGLLIALLIHSILEGVSIGVQTKISQVMLIFGAVTFHKIVLSFCLGLELHHQGFNVLPLVVTILVFSIGSPVGIFIGMTVLSLKKDISSVDAQLQAVAAGSLLYVAVLEVLPRERFKWQRSSQRAAGIFQLIFVLLGFLCITIFHFFMGS